MKQIRKWFNGGPTPDPVSFLFHAWHVRFG